MLDSAALRARLGGVRDRIARAAGRVGRDPASIRLIAVSKTFSVDHIQAAADAGQVDFGENKVQEALSKMDAARGMGLCWHLIGHLQSNKARKAGARFDAIHSLDDAELLGRLDEAALAAGRRIDLLVQVDLAGGGDQAWDRAGYPASALRGRRGLPRLPHCGADGAAAGGDLARGRPGLTSDRSWPSATS